ncbi:MAG: transcriptional repressor [Oscillospiraceae bacterium]|nr:transcriptional repressor [Oscillospiraceae bacterium]
MRYGQSILDLINHSSDHMTAEQIFLTLKEQFPAVVIATVYNNLNNLYRQGQIRKISMEGQPDRYDKHTRHDHLICCRCGKLSDIMISDLTADLEKQIGCSIESYDLKVQYLCPACREKETP